MSVAMNVVAKMNELMPGAAVEFRVHQDAYFDVIKSMALFSKQKDNYIIYITSTLPSSNIIDLLQMLGIETDRIFFVDCISRIMMGSVAVSDKVIYVESPTMLENIMLKVEYLSRLDDVSTKGAVVVLDSINTMAIHNNPRIMSEFLHIFVNSLRGKNFYTAIMVMEDGTLEDSGNLTKFVCEESIPIGAPEE